MVHDRVGSYRIVRLLGEGGMGLVYEAIRDDIGGRAAIKILRAEFSRSPDITSRFLNEARAVNIVQHPGVVRVFDFGQLPSGEPYLTMEFLDGQTLRDRITSYGRLDEKDTMRLARQIASAVAAAHAKQIIHRDLKPENVMIVQDAEVPEGERAKVLDFGIAKVNSVAQGRAATIAHTMLGTPLYMSPEQCRGLKTINDRTDVYALGIMMFEMLTGQPPFVSENAGDIVGMHMFKPPPSLRAAIPDLDPQLHRLIESMITKEPEQRPSMTSVSEQLKALGNFQSVVIPRQALGKPKSKPTASITPPDQSLPKNRNASPLPRPAPALLPAPSPITQLKSEDSDKTQIMKGAADFSIPTDSHGAEHPTAPPSGQHSEQQEPEEEAARRWSQPEAPRLTGALLNQRVGRMVFIGLLVVALLLGAMVLLVGCSQHWSQ